nr:hypothetical protein [Tanacetum cinerariifolium]
MADQRTMTELLRAPTDGYAEANVVPPIPAEHFELKHSLINLSKVHNSRNKLIVSKVKASNVDSSEIASAVASTVTSAMTTMFKQHQITPAPASVKAVEESCVTCGSAHSYRQCPATDGITFSGYQDNIHEYVSAAAVNYNQGNTGFCPLNTASTLGSGSLPSNTIANLMGDLKAITTQSGVSYDEPPIPPPFSSLPKVVERVSEPKPTIPYPSRVTKQKLREKDDNPALKFVEIFRKLHFDLSFADALLHMPKFALMFKSLLNNKEKLFDLATTSVNENCSTVILKKLPEKLGDPDKFLIPCDFSELDECLALADLAGIAEDVFVKVGKFHFPTDFVVVDYVVDPRVTLILERPFLRTRQALINVYGEELTLRVDDEAITFKVGQTLKYSYNDAESINRIDVVDVACEEGGDFILEEIEACLTSKSIPPRIDDIDFDLEGDIRLLEK